MSTFTYTPRYVPQTFSMSLSRRPKESSEFRKPSRAESNLVQGPLFFLVYIISLNLIMRRTLGPVSSSGLNSRPSMGRQSMGLPSKGPQRTSMAMGSSRQSMSARNQSLGRKSTGISRETMARGGSRQDPVSILVVWFRERSYMLSI